jgi:hypothetical protein
MCPIRLPSGRSGVIFSLPVTFLADQARNISNETVLNPDSVERGGDVSAEENRLWFAYISPDGLEIEPIVTTVPYQIGSGRLSCKDINSDGHFDIAWEKSAGQVVAGNTDLGPVFFLVEASDVFRPVYPSTVIPATINRYRDNVQTFIGDLNQDGIYDLIVLPGSIGSGFAPIFQVHWY